MNGLVNKRSICGPIAQNERNVHRMLQKFGQDLALSEHLAYVEGAGVWRLIAVSPEDTVSLSICAESPSL